MKKLFTVFTFVFIFNTLFSQSEIKIIEDLILKNDINQAISYLKQYETKLKDEEKRYLFYLYCWVYFIKKEYDIFLDYAKNIGTKNKDDIFYNTLLLTSIVYFKTNKEKKARKVIDYILKSDSKQEYKLGALLVDRVFSKKEKTVGIDLLIEYIVKDYAAVIESEKTVCKPLAEIEVERKNIEKEKKELEVLRLLLDEKKRLLNLKEEYLKEKDSIKEKNSKKEEETKKENKDEPEKKEENKLKEGGK